VGGAHPPEAFETARQGFEAAGMACGDAEISMVPANTVAVDAETGARIIRLMEALETTTTCRRSIPISICRTTSWRRWARP
jgi:transcriptional/translational regulatory protein YebC/TACO1